MSSGSGDVRDVLSWWSLSKGSWLPCQPSQHSPTPVASITRFPTARPLGPDSSYAFKPLDLQNICTTAPAEGQLPLTASHLYCASLLGEPKLLQQRVSQAISAEQGLLRLGFKSSIRHPPRLSATFFFSTARRSVLALREVSQALSNEAGTTQRRSLLTQLHPVSDHRFIRQQSNRRQLHFRTLLPQDAVRQG